ncbi:MAG TPA: hypothetical protein VG815_21765, partial [Chloroflexota bacterium]|nr:hypothetical protein [Chloroflexota bacterium]
WRSRASERARGGGAPGWGDIMLVQIKDRPTVHRVRRLAPAIITRGDGSASNYEPVTHEDLLGIVTAVERHGRWFRLPRGRLNVPVACVLIALANVNRLMLRGW